MTSRRLWQTLFAKRNIFANAAAFRSFHGDLKTVAAKRYVGQALLGAGGCLYLYYKITPFPSLEASEPSSSASEDGDHGYKSHASQFNFIADAVEKAAPAVVYIECRGFAGPFSRTSSAGSGFIVRDDGLIVTNAHVVANKQTVTVRLPDGREFDGVVQVVDPVSDLATVKINASGLPVLKLASSKEVRPGEWVVAMGSPLSLSNTVTAGIVSSASRQSRELGINNDIEYIQTDASITFGNSGGPLINLNGEAVGVNTMKIASGINISFAIPSHYVKDFLARADKFWQTVERKKKGSVASIPSAESARRYYIGVATLTLKPQLLWELRQRMPGFPSDVDAGILVSRVAVGSPADIAGLQPGDVIVGIDGKGVAKTADLYAALKGSTSVALAVVRGHRRLVLSVTPEAVD